MKTPEGADILNTIDSVKRLTNDITDVFREHMIMGNDEIREHTRGIYYECEELEKRLLLLYALGYARLDRVNKGKQ